MNRKTDLPMKSFIICWESDKKWITDVCFECKVPFIIVAVTNSLHVNVPAVNLLCQCSIGSLNRIFSWSYYSALYEGLTVCANMRFAFIVLLKFSVPVLSFSCVSAFPI